jgi:aminopeptidase C
MTKYIQVYSDWDTEVFRINDSNYKLDSECVMPAVFYNQFSSWEIPENDIELIKSENKWKYKIKVENCVTNGTIIPIIHNNEERLQNEKCKYCNENKSVIFVPCGHFVCCDKCSMNCFKCPVCKKTTNRIQSEKVC